MKILPLYDLQQEINRLFIAGSKFAKNDPRLQKQAAVFNKLGEKSPVFKRIAEGIENLLNAESADSSGNLLEISTLLYAVLYTQGETAGTDPQETELTPVLPLDQVQTDKSYLALKPLIEALTQQKGERLSDVRTAFRNGQVNDFRIYPLIDAALADRYTELADYLETAVIPAIGKPVMPCIINGFNYEGNTGDIRRFRILHKFDYDGIPEMVDRIFAGKSIPLQAEAVKTLSKNPENEDLLLKFADDKNKVIRMAAYQTLTELKTESAEKTLVELFISGKRKSDTLELGKILRARLQDKFVPTLLDKAKADYKKCIEPDKYEDIKAMSAAFETLNASMNTLVNNANKDVMEFYRDMFTGKKYRDLSKTAESKISYLYMPGMIADSAARNLENTQEGFECLEFLSKNSSFDEFMYSYFKVSVRNKVDRKKVFSNFSKHIDKLIDKHVFAEIFPDRNEKLNPEDIDERWIKLLENKLPKKKHLSLEDAKVYIGLTGEKNEKLQSFLSNIISAYGE
ncbi:MAG: HEAT repeat domain-containing protein [Prevotellaceae bacterium]|jgi:hypothetical protein|nr:HEAT repeat domain-containing protein [Prevotellaceae bacterium]